MSQRENATWLPFAFHALVGCCLRNEPLAQKLPWTLKFECVFSCILCGVVTHRLGEGDCAGREMNCVACNCYIHADMGICVVSLTVSYCFCVARNGTTALMVGGGESVQETCARMWFRSDKFVFKALL